MHKLNIFAKTIKPVFAVFAWWPAHFG